MTKLFLALLLMLPLSCNHKPKLSPETKSPIEMQHSTTHRVGVYDIHAYDTEVGHCSGTAVGPHALLTAAHCINDSNLVRLDSSKKPVVILAVLLDGNDHAIFIVNHDFSQWSQVVQRTLVPKESCHFWGSPGFNSDVFRTGYFEKMRLDKPVDDDGKPVENGRTLESLVFVLPVFPGDSGSGLFDDSGNIVAVVSRANTSANMVDFALRFTAGQIHVATEIPAAPTNVTSKAH